ncbi:Scr1 family TA system antitoxin-like transcriptional regulator [Flindersiella endophytica]
MRFEVLGPLQVRRGGSAVRLQARLPRRLLGVLLSRAGRPIAASELIEAIWEDSPPGDATKALQIYVHRLRRQLGETERIALDPVGYAAVVHPGELDAIEFEERLRRARAALQNDSSAEASKLLDQAMSLWRGRPYGGLEDCVYLEPEVKRLVELWLQGLEDRAEIALQGGRHVDLIPELLALASEYPYREQFTYLLMLALYRSGRLAEALDAFQRVRARLAEDLGIDVGPALRDLHERVLREDPDLGGASARNTQPALPHEPGIQVWSAAFNVRPMPAITYLREYESTATEIRTYESMVVPGLFQAEGYIRALFQQARFSLSREGLEQAIAVRLERQSQVLSRSRPDIHIVLDEGAVRRPVGGSEVHRRQLEKLSRAAESSMASFRLVPPSVGAYPGVVGPFTIFDFGEDVRPPLAYVEGRAGSLFLEDAVTVRQCRAAFDSMHEVALSHEASVRRLGEIMEEL